MGVSLKPGQSFSLWHLYDYLEEETDLNRDEIDSSLDYLSRMGLIEGGVQRTLDEGEDVALGALLPEGFEVAHERELKREQIAMNENLVVFTFALVAVGIINTLPSEGRVILQIALLVTIAAWVNREHLPSLESLRSKMG